MAQPFPPMFPMIAKLQKLEADIEAQRKKLEQLKAQKQQIEARERAKLRGIERKNDTRRKILAGAMVVEMMQSDEDVKRKIMARLDGFLTRPDDRALFDLPATLPADPPALPQGAPETLPGTRG